MAVRGGLAAEPSPGHVPRNRVFPRDDGNHPRSRSWGCIKVELGKIILSEKQLAAAAAIDRKKTNQQYTCC